MADSADLVPEPGKTNQSAVVDRALAVADLRVLAVCLYHMTGDRRWLEPPFQPQRDVRLIADPLAGFGPDEQAEMVATARAWLLDPQRTTAVADPGPDDFGEVVSIFLGEAVPREYLPLIREDFGFDPAHAEWTEPTAVDQSRDVLIVGAGVSGICLAIRLLKLGMSVRIVDKNGKVAYAKVQEIKVAREDKDILAALATLS